MDDIFQDIDADFNHFGLFDSLSDSFNINKYDSDAFNQIIAENNVLNNNKDISIVHINIRSITKNGTYSMSFFKNTPH